MIKQYKLYLGLLTVFSLLVYGSLKYIDFLKSQTDNLKDSSYKTEATHMQQKVSSMIYEKQKATVALALSISKNPYLAEDVIKNNITAKYYEDLIDELRENTLYKNIWVQILDARGVSLYRSWTEQKGDNLIHLRKDLAELVREKKVISSISVGKFDLSIKAMVPLFWDEKFIGIIELISHFNSISSQLAESDIDSVVVLKKEFRKSLQFPFTGMFIGDYYVANFDAPKILRDYLEKYGVENYFNDSYKVENNFIISSYPLKGQDSQVLGYYIMFKKTDKIAKLDLDFLKFKWLAFSVITLMLVMIVVSLILFFANRKQKIYYKNIINTASNIVVLNDGKKILDVNRAFFRYFDKYNTIEEFKEQHQCICDFFVAENGYIDKVVEGKNWVDYLLENKNKNSKVKIRFFEKEYYFSISASMNSVEKNHYSVVLSDMTQEENYKKELEILSITDALTGIGNRRYFHQKIQEEMKRSLRYNNVLSLVMFDIDYFKQVNDKYGHDTGDRVLIEYTKMIAGTLRETDIFCRIGGEEFVIILPHANKESAQKIAEQLRIDVETSKIILPLTMSFGVIEYEKGEELEFVFKRADEALYAAKNGGRNRVVVG
jgi:diguanylate cyclase (GGDEF)-like protein